jgi:hypothetical protein
MVPKELRKLAAWFNEKPRVALNWPRGGILPAQPCGRREERWRRRLSLRRDDDALLRALRGPRLQRRLFRLRLQKRGQRMVALCTAAGPKPWPLPYLES